MSKLSKSQLGWVGGGGLSFGQSPRFGCFFKASLIKLLFDSGTVLSTNIHNLSCSLTGLKKTMCRSVFVTEYPVRTNCGTPPDSQENDN